MAIRQVTIDELKNHLSLTHQPRRIDEVILHHTWRPRAWDYSGRGTWDSIRRYHMHQRGWSDVGYHIGIAPDDSIWLLRPIERSGAHCLNHNAHSIGVVMIGNFDEEDPAANGLQTAAEVCAAVCEAYNLLPNDVYFHRDFSTKTCPGTCIDRGDFRVSVGARINQESANMDISPWAQESVDWCREFGIMTGDPFRGKDPLTREEAAVVFKRMHDLFYM